MRLLHTADWHLGRQLYGASLLEDQAFILDQLVELAREASVDAVIVAGDVYDRAVPPADAVALLDRVLEALTVAAGIPVLLIAGNHDGAERIGFAARMLAPSGLHMFGPLIGCAPVVLHDDHGPVYFTPLPYADPPTVRAYLRDEDGAGDAVHDHDAALRALLTASRDQIPEGVRRIAIGHCWVTGGTASESERPLTVGGAGQVAAEAFDDFHYTALGHLHRPQSCGPRIHYPGSLLKYSFSEAEHQKSVNLVELDAAGAVTVERVPLDVRRDLRVLEGRLADLLDGAETGAAADDYLLVRLLDRQAILDPIGKLRAVYPNVLHLERPALQGGETATRAARDHRRLSELELFTAFHEEVVGGPVLDGGEAALQEVVETLRRQAREAAS